MKPLKFWGPDEKDRIRNRRNLAFFSAIYSLVIWPNLLIFFHLIFDLQIDLIKALLMYIGTIASGTIGAYIWAAMKDTQNGKKDD